MENCLEIRRDRSRPPANQNGGHRHARSLKHGRPAKNLRILVDGQCPDLCGGHWISLSGKRCYGNGNSTAVATARALVDGFGELEVLDAGFEAGLGVAAGEDGVDEVLLDGPFGDELGGDFEGREFLVAAAGAEDLVGGEIVDEGARRGRKW